MREITNRLKKCIAPKVIRTKPSLSLNISMAARELVTVASLFKASVTPNINQIETHHQQMVHECRRLGIALKGIHQGIVLESLSLVLRAGWHLR